MKRFIAATALTGFAFLGCASSASATPHEGSMDAHAALIHGLNQAGITVVVNSRRCAGVPGEPKFKGAYTPASRIVNVCQENGVPGGDIVEWTLNDLDTLRHEAHHVVQDCLAGTEYDGQLKSVYPDTYALAVKTLGQVEVNRIIFTYLVAGADDHTIKMELEAFVIAARNTPFAQRQLLSSACGIQ